MIRTFSGIILVILLSGQWVYAASDSSRIARDLQIARSIVYTQPDHAFSLIRPSLSASKSISNTLYAEACNTMGIYLDVIGKYDESLHMYRTGLHALQSSHQPSQSAGILSNIGLLHWSQNALDSALQQFNQAAQLYQKDGNAGGMGSVYSNIGLVYKKDGQNERAIQFFQKALQAQLSLNDSLSIARTYGNLGMMYNIKEAVDTANRYYRVALTYFEGEPQGTATVFHNMALGWKHANRLDSALLYAQRALDLRKSMEHPPSVAATNALLGRIYAEQNHPEDAIPPLKSAALFYAQSERKSEQLKLYKLLAKMYEEIGNSASASSYWKNYAQLSDSLFQRERQAQISRINSLLQEEEQQRLDAEKQRDQALIRYNKLLDYVFIGSLLSLILLIAAVIAFVLWRRKMKRRQRLIESRLKMVSNFLHRFEVETETQHNSWQLPIRDALWGLQPITGKSLATYLEKAVDQFPDGVITSYHAKADYSELQPHLAMQFVEIVRYWSGYWETMNPDLTCDVRFQSFGGDLELEMEVAGAEGHLVRTNPAGAPIEDLLSRELHESEIQISFRELDEGFTFSAKAVDQ
jgi:hypothetical protein